MEVLSLHAVLKESEEILFNCPLKPTRAERLIVVKDGCDKVLVDLQSLVDKYESLGTQSKRTWDRMKWGNEDIAEIRARLISSTTMLNAFISTSESSVESKLDKFLEEYRQGRRETSVVSLQTVDSLSTDDKAVWRTIRKELEDIGISIAAFDTNRNLIFDWFIRAVETGAFEEQGEHGTDDENDLSDEQASSSNDKRANQDAGQVIRHTQSASFTDIREERPSAQPQSSVATTVAEPHSPRGQNTSDGIVASTRVFKGIPVSRIAAFWAAPGRRLLRAVEARHFSKALKILSDEASLKHLDQQTLDETLLSTTMQKDVGTLFGDTESSNHLSLVSMLIARGANVDYKSSDSSRQQSPLYHSIARRSIGVVRLLIENGADVNCWLNGYESGPSAPRLALTLDPGILDLLLSAGLDTSTEYLVPGMGFGYDELFTFTLIHEAAYLGLIPAIQALIRHGTEIDLVTDKCGTALMVALFGGKEHVAKYLLDRGANPDFDAGKIHFRYETGSGEINAELSYERPIEAAIVRGELSMVILLLKCGVLLKPSTLVYAKGIMSRLSSKQRDPPFQLASLEASTWTTADNDRREDSEIIRVLKEAVTHQIIERSWA